MGGHGHLDNILIISSTKNATTLFKDMLTQMLPEYTVFSAKTAREARELLGKRMFFLCLVNAPLNDEFGDLLAFEMAKDDAGQVLLIVKKDLYDSILQKAESSGVILMSKPIIKTALIASINASKACFRRLERLSGEKSKLTEQIDNIKLIDRAKCMLIEVLRMTEQDAHRYIEKQAMDMRKSKRDIAENILKTYGL